jgi:hypothetical protein
VITETVSGARGDSTTMGPIITLEMAQSARDKLHASAREIWSSIRSLDESSRGEMVDGGRSPKSEGSMSMSFEKIESVLKVMFASCTTGVPPHNQQEPTPTPLACERSRSASSREFLATKDIGEHVYAQLFMDDQTRASKAVDGLRLKAAASSPRSKSSSRASHSPQPKTSPVHSVPDAPPSTRAVDISALSFDDGISAISAHTLDEMARVHDHTSDFYNQSEVARQLSSSSKVEKISYSRSSRSSCRGEQNVGSPRIPRGPSIITPVKFTRGPSHGTHGSKTTHSSKATKSTTSTHDSGFASVWRNEERKYWDDVVQNDKKDATGGSARHSVSKKFSRQRSQSVNSSVSTVSGMWLLF